MEMAAKLDSTGNPQQRNTTMDTRANGNNRQ